MSVKDATACANRGARLVPLTFEKYIATMAPVSAGTKCEVCGAPAAIARDGRNAACAACLHYQFGYDQAEEKLVRATIGAAVSGALARRVRRTRSPRCR